MTYCENAHECVEGADAVVIATEWEQFRALDLERLRDLMACPVMVDLRNIYRPEDVQRRGFAYASIGRTQSTPIVANGEMLPALLARARESVPSL